MHKSAPRRLTAGRAGTASFDRYILSEALILRQDQDERRVEGLRMSALMVSVSNHAGFTVRVAPH
jgi:hypothetical protein